MKADGWRVLGYRGWLRKLWIPYAHNCVWGECRRNGAIRRVMVFWGTRHFWVDFPGGPPKVYPEYCRYRVWRGFAVGRYARPRE